MEALYIVAFILPLVVDMCIGYESYKSCHSVVKSMQWFFAVLLFQVLVGASIL